MSNVKVMELYLTFMSDYIEFLGRMVEDEKRKLAALSSRALPQIEQSIAVSQADAKRLENYENKRILMQGEAGHEGLSFREMTEQVTEDVQEKMVPLLAAFEKHVVEIRFYNDKSMALARDNMLGMDPEAVLPGQPGAKPSNPYQKQRVAQAEQDGILQTKI